MSDQRPMRVLHVITWLNKGGVEAWLMRILSNIPRDRCAMDFACKGQKRGVWARDAVNLGADVYLVPMRPVPMGFCRGLFALLKNGGYDIVHNHLEAHSGWPVAIARRLGIPVLTSFHNTRFPAQTWLDMPGLRQMRNMYAKFSIRRAVRYSDAVTGCSQAVVDGIISRCGVDSQKIEVLSYAVDEIPVIDSDGRRAFRTEMGFGKDDRIVVHVGRFHEQKNHAGLLKAFAGVGLPDVHLVIVGDGPLRPAMEALARDLKIAQNIRFLGTRDDVGRILAASDVFFFPSLHEGFGLAALEAGAAGLPVVGSDVPGLNEAVIHGTTGLLFPLDDMAAMTGALRNLLRDSEARDRLGRAGRERVMADFSNRASAEKLLSLYEDVLCTKRAAGKVQGTP